MRCAPSTLIGRHCQARIPPPPIPARCQHNANSVPLQLWHPWPLTLSYSHLPLPQTHRIHWGSVWFTSTLTVLSTTIAFNVHRRALFNKGHLAFSNPVYSHFYLFFPNKPHFFLSSNITLSLGTVPDMGRQARSNPSLQSPAGTNPSDKGVWEREMFSCWMHNLSSVYSPVHLHHRQ